MASGRFRQYFFGISACIAFTFSRAGYTGAGAFPTHWAGDENSLWEAYRRSIVAGLTAGLVSPLVSGSALALALTMGALLLPGWLAWRRYLVLAGD